MAKKKTTQKEDKAVQPEKTENVPETKDKKSKKGAKPESEPVPAPVKQEKTIGKTKYIKKGEKPFKEEEQPEPIEEKHHKKGKGGRHHEPTTVSLFTPDFYAKIDTFQSFYKEVLELRSSSNNTDLTSELTNVNGRVRESLQSASSRILKEELVSLENWIDSEQKRLQSEIETINKAYEENQKSLESTKAFTVDEIQTQLQPIRDRVNQKQSQLDNYGELLTRSRNIYQASTTDIQEEKEEQQPVQGENNNNEAAEVHDELGDDLDLQ